MKQQQQQKAQTPQSSTIPWWEKRGLPDPHKKPQLFNYMRSRGEYYVE